MAKVVPAFSGPDGAVSEAAISAAAEAIREGDIVGIPTDTVYGLVADPWHSGAVDRLFRLKGRPRSVELPLFVADIHQALALATSVPSSAHRLMQVFWPGALTIVLPRRGEIEADLGEEDETIGLRCPDHPVPIAMCKVVGPFASTSANRHGEPPATTAEELLSRLPGVDLVLDGGRCEFPPSTVVDCTGDPPRLLRQGAIDWTRVAEVTAAS